MIRATLVGSGPRAAKWEARFGRRWIEVESLKPIPAELPGLGVRLVYKARVASLTPEQRARVIASIASEFAVSIQEVEEGFNDPKQGLPILASDVVVAEVV